MNMHIHCVRVRICLFVSLCVRVRVKPCLLIKNALRCPVLYLCRGPQACLCLPSRDAPGRNGGSWGVPRVSLLFKFPSQDVGHMMPMHAERMQVRACVCEDSHCKQNWGLVARIKGNCSQGCKTNR